MKNTLKNIYYLLCEIINVLITLSSIILFSKFNRKDIVNSTNCCSILGNGPSLNDNLNNDIFRDSTRSLYVVNWFCLSEWFIKLKPQNYVIVDPGFYDVNVNSLDRHRDQLFSILSIIDWDMKFYIPNLYRKTLVAKKIRNIANKKIEIIYINTTPINGPKWFRNWCIGHKLGMPQPYNVLNAAIAVAIFNKIVDIEIFGADHSWLRDLYHNENGQLCSRNTHLYGSNEFIMPKGSLEDGLLSFAKCLKSYRYLKDYADANAIKIVNRTRNSYLDVFDNKFC